MRKILILFAIFSCFLIISMSSILSAQAIIVEDEIKKSKIYRIKLIKEKFNDISINRQLSLLISLLLIIEIVFYFILVISIIIMGLIDPDLYGNLSILGYFILTLFFDVLIHIVGIVVIPFMIFVYIYAFILAIIKLIKENLTNNIIMN